MSDAIPVTNAEKRLRNVLSGPLLPTWKVSVSQEDAHELLHELAKLRSLLESTHD